MAHGYEALTEREKQTLRLLLVGHDAKSLARHFGLSVHTINERLRDARRKLSVSSSKEAARQLREIEAGPENIADEQFGDAKPASGDHLDPQPNPARRSRRRAIWAIGGLAMLSLVAAILALAVPNAMPTEAAGQSTTLPETDVSRAAREWLTLVDAAKWNESWAAAGEPFKSLNTVEAWRSASEQARAPLGDVASRTLVREDDTPAPPHGYRTVRFRTLFARKTATETLSLDRESAGWKVVGIYID